MFNDRIKGKTKEVIGAGKPKLGEMTGASCTKFKD